MIKQEKWLQKVFEHAQAVEEYCDKYGYYRVFTGLYGSQNYGLADEHSDVDTKSLIVPSASDWVWNNDGKANIVLTMPDGSHAELKPIVSMFKQFQKGNVNFLEIIDTPYVDINADWEWLYMELFDHFNDICEHNKYMQSEVLLGYVRQMEKRTLSTDEDYDSKAFMHYLRLRNFVQRYLIEGQSFGQALDCSDEYAYLVGTVKAHRFHKETVYDFINESEKWYQDIRKIVNERYTDEEKFDTNQFFRSLAIRTMEQLVSN